MGYELIEEQTFSDAWQRFTGEFDGVNVTAPFKEDAFRAAKLHSPECEAIGAANILIKTEDGVMAHNSDYLAVRECLKSCGGKALVAGWGGAGKAAECAARSLGLDVTVCNRTIAAKHIRPLEELPELACECDILIYTLPCPVGELPSVRKESGRAHV